MMSEPMLFWMLMTFSGEKKCLLPSWWERNSTPSSESLRMSFRLKTWKPPLSVRMGLFQLAKRCRPPLRASRSSPGRRYRW
jgi:hypothetical protein